MPLQRRLQCRHFGITSSAHNTVPCRCRCNSVEDPSILLQDFCGPQCKHCSRARGCRKFVPCKPEAQCCSGTLAYGGQSGYSALHAAVRGRGTSAPTSPSSVHSSLTISLSPLQVFTEAGSVVEELKKELEQVRLMLRAQDCEIRTDHAFSDEFEGGG